MRNIIWRLLPPMYGTWLGRLTGRRWIAWTDGAGKITKIGIITDGDFAALMKRTTS